MNNMFTYVALLRGINVGGHHKVSMAELSKEMINLGFANVVTILNSGNIIFDAPVDQEELVEVTISEHLEKVLGFSVPVLIRKKEEFLDLLQNNPFRNAEITEDTRLYVSFLKEVANIGLELPWTSPDGSFLISEVRGRAVYTVLNLALNKTAKAMEVLEHLFGKDITTRNWNTIERIAVKITSQ